MRFSIVSVMVIPMGLLCGAHTALAYPPAPDPATCTWTAGGSDSDWFNGANWSTPAPPTAAQSASLGIPSAWAIINPNTTGFPGSFPGAAASLCVGQGDDGLVHVYQDPAPAKPTPLTTGTAWVGYGQDPASNDVGRVDLYSLDSGTAPTVPTWSCTDLHVGCDGDGMVKANAGTWLDVSGTTAISYGDAYYSDAKIELVQNAQLTTQSLTVGVTAGAATGGGDRTGCLYVSDGSSCTVTQDTVLGDGPGSRGDIHTWIGAPATLTLGNLVAGKQGNGSVYVSNGGQLNCGPTVLGEQATAHGQVILDGAGTTANVTGRLDIADIGHGYFQARDGAAVNHVGDCYIAANPNTAGGNIELSDSSTWTTTGHMYIGGNPTDGDAPGRPSVYVGESWQTTGDNVLEVSQGITVYGQAGNESEAAELRLRPDAVVRTPLVTVDYGLLKGAGTIEGNVDHRGIFSVGTSPGLLTIDGDLTVSGDGNTRSTFSVWGTTPITEYSHCHVTGEAQLDGTMECLFDDRWGYVPQAGDTFTILTADRGVFGTYDNGWWPAGRLGDDLFPVYGLTMDVQYEQDRVIVRLLGGGPQPIPEPSSLPIWALGLLGLAWYAWRKRR